MPDKKKKKNIQDLSNIRKSYTANQVDSIIKNSDLTFRDFTEKYNMKTGKSVYYKKYKVGAKALPNFPGDKKEKIGAVLLKKGGITKKKTMKKKYGHGGKLKTASLLDKVKTTYEMGGVMEKYAMGGKLKEVMPNQKGLAKLPTEVRNKMGYMRKGGMMKEYRMGGKMEYGHGGMMMKPGKGLPKQHD